MKAYPLTWTLSSFKTNKNKINPSPIYQRQAAWTMAQKQLLMDSIVRKYDIPKIYLHEKEDGTYDVIDGQQRIQAFWSFFEDEFALPKDAASIGGVEVANKKFSELDSETAAVVNNYQVNVVLVVTEDMGEISDMFIRLQNGTKLKAQEIRNALLGKISVFVRDLATKHKFFKKLSISDTRANFDLIAAQMTLLAIKKDKGICSVRKADLDSMYVHYSDFDKTSPAAKTIRKVLDYLNRMFEEKTPELKKNYIVISLFILIMDLLSNYDIKGREAEIYDWFIEFESNRENAKKNDKRFVEYHERISHSTDREDSLQFRHDFLKESLLASIPDLPRLPQKDGKRFFDETQRILIYRRDKGICQKCKKPCKFEEFHADHKKPHSKGGKTTIENGRVLCPTCNAKKGDKEE